MPPKVAPQTDEGEELERDEEPERGCVIHAVRAHAAAGDAADEAGPEGFTGSADSRCGPGVAAEAHRLDPLELGIKVAADCKLVVDNLEAGGAVAAVELDLKERLLNGLKPVLAAE